MKNKLTEAIRAVPLSQTYEDYVEALADKLIDTGIVIMPCIVYNKKADDYQVVTLSKQRHLISSKMYATRTEAEAITTRRRKNENLEKT